MLELADFSVEFFLICCNVCGLAQSYLFMTLGRLKVVIKLGIGPCLVWRSTVVLGMNRLPTGVAFVS